MAVLSPAPPELRGLLAAAKAAPDDDAPRLVVADWLEEHGGEVARDLAEMIRAQCTLLNLFAAAASPARPGAVRRLLVACEHVQGRGGAPWLRAGGAPDAPELDALHRQTLHLAFGRLAELLRPLGPLGPHQWPRGLARADLYPEALGDGDAYADSLAGQMLGGLRLMRGWEGAEDRLAGARLLGGLIALDLSDLEYRHVPGPALLASPHLAGLRRLNADCRALGDEALAAILRAAPWRLTELSLSHNNLTATGVRALARSPALAGLTSLNLGESRIGVNGARALARAPFLGKLQVLNLAGCGLGPQGLRELLGAGGYRGPAALDLSRCRLGREGVEVLLRAPGLENLVALSLAHNGLDRRAFELLGASPRLAKLLLLDVSARGGEAAAGEELTASPHLGGLLWGRRADNGEWARRETTAVEAGVVYVLRGLLTEAPPF